MEMSHFKVGEVLHTAWRVFLRAISQTTDFRTLGACWLVSSLWTWSSVTNRSLWVRRALEDLALVQALVQQVDPSECQTLRNQSSSDNLPSAVRDSHKFEEGHC